MAGEKHTAGEWTVTSKAGFDGHGVSAGGKRICSINANSPLPKGERNANARLIAAAPAMKEALEAVVANCISHHPDATEALAKAVAALAATEDQ